MTFDENYYTCLEKIKTEKVVDVTLAGCAFLASPEGPGRKQWENWDGTLGYTLTCTCQCTVWPRPIPALKWETCPLDLSKFMMIKFTPHLLVEQETLHGLYVCRHESVFDPRPGSIGQWININIWMESKLCTLAMRVWLTLQHCARVRRPSPEGWWCRGGGGTRYPDRLPAAL